MYNKPLLLFDIDWTLLKGGLAEHVDGFTYAWNKVLGITAHLSDWKDYHGQPDGVILSKIPVLCHGVDQETVKLKQEALKQAKIDYFFEHAQKDYKHLLMPGVIDLLHELEKRTIPMVIASGNLEKIGWYRLEKAGIKKFFLGGGWGDSVSSKSEAFLLAIAASEKILLQKIPKEHIFDIGDSHYDIEAARAIGIHSIGVLTGFDSEDVLRKSGAEYVLKNLTDTKKFFEMIKI
ncbi:HAD family hydrolase [Candidatus Gottesmanbacteria bacterium]|nr:HAD family hydrolase [Candidatus Gottesmanbacteria bacterium]